MIHHLVYLNWLTIYHGSGSYTFVFKDASAIRTGVTDADFLYFVGILFTDTGSAMTFMAYFAAAVIATNPPKAAGKLLGFTGTFEEGVEEPKKPSWAVRSWRRSLPWSRVISSSSSLIFCCFSRHCLQYVISIPAGGDFWLWGTWR